MRGRWVKVTAEALPSGHYAWVEFGRDVAASDARRDRRAEVPLGTAVQISS